MPVPWYLEARRESVENRTYQTQTTNLGDDYEIRAPIGLAPERPEWALVFNGTYAQIQEHIQFLDERGGTASFTFLHPDTGAALRVVCEKWRQRPGRGPWRILDATFRVVKT